MPVVHFDDLYTVLDAHKADDPVTLKILRGDTPINVTLKLMALTAPGLI